jgi:vanillate/4-hydroxybenzoate decarboxylase subunit D
MESSRPLVCPRCRSTTIEVRSRSPVAGVWTVFGCATCLYAWRSTEPEENTDPDKYPAVFRLKPEDLANLPVAPSIPPRRRR